MNFVRNGYLGRKVWKTLGNTCQWVDKRMQFRGSGLPFCPRAFWLDQKHKPATRESYRDLVVVDRGRAIHLTTQRWLGRAGLLFGNWECPTCRVTLGSPYVVKNALGTPGRCPRHGRELVYQEYELSHSGMTGHPDGLLPLGDLGTLRGQTNWKFAVLEIKTINSSWWYSKLKKAPLPAHVEQVNAYACMVPEALGLPVEKALVWYISSDHPESQPITFEFTPDPQRFKKHLACIKEIEGTHSSKPPRGICTPGDQYPYCPVLPCCDLRGEA
jgi:hypothetical protein